VCLQSICLFWSATLVIIFETEISKSNLYHFVSTFVVTTISNSFFFAVLNGLNPSHKLTKYGRIIPYDSSSSVSAWFSDGIDEFPSSSEDQSEQEDHQDEAMSPRSSAVAAKKAKKKKEQEAQEEAALLRTQAGKTRNAKANGNKPTKGTTGKASGTAKSGGGTSKPKPSSTGGKKQPPGGKKQPPTEFVNVTSSSDKSSASSVSSDLEGNKKKRRGESVSNVGQSANAKRLKQAHDDIEGLAQENERLKDKQARITQELALLKAKTAHTKHGDADDDEDDDAQTTITTFTSTSRRSKKKSRAKGKKKGKQLTVKDFVRIKAKAQFRYVKFNQTEKQFKKNVASNVMDEVEDDSLHHEDGETPEEAAKVELARAHFYDKYKSVMTSGFNEERNYRQTRVKDACTLWLINHRQTTTTLFSLEDLEAVMKRDLSAWEPKLDAEGNETDPGDPVKLAYLHELQEFYVDKLIPACSGANEFAESVRHFVPLCVAKFSTSSDVFPGKLIVPP
jgi:hypothetical protein